MEQKGPGLGSAIVPSKMGMASILDIDPDIPRRSPFHRRRDVLRTGSIDDITRILSQRAAPGPGIGITPDTSAVRKDGRAWIVGPKGVVDTRGIVKVKRRQVPVRQDVVAGHAVVVGLRLVAHGGWGTGLDETAVERRVERCPVVVTGPAGISGSLKAVPLI